MRVANVRSGPRVSTADMVVSTFIVEAGVSGPTEMLLMENSYHMITIDRERRMLARRSAQFFGAIGPEPLALEPAA